VMPQVVLAATVSSAANQAAEKAQAAGRANRELAFEALLKPGPLELVGKRTSLSANCPFSAALWLRRLPRGSDPRARNWRVEP
jgi:hypothetical protein